MTDDLMSVNILICYSFGDELGGNEITYITLKPYDFSLKQMADFNKFLSNKGYVQDSLQMDLILL
jgi:hypothetical protein